MALRINAHEFADTSRPLAAAFAGAPNVDFTVEGAPVNRHSAIVSTGINMTTRAANIFLRYDGQYGTLDDSSAITGGLAFMW